MGRGERIKFDFRPLAQAALYQIGDKLVEQGQANMDKKSYGKTYVVNGKLHTASKEGDSPNNMTGELRKTIRFDVRGITMEFGAGNGTVNYPKYLEALRPNINKSVIQQAPYIERTLSKLFINNIRYD